MFGSRNFLFTKTAEPVVQGQLWNWGTGSNGALGQNNTISRSSPVQVGSSTDWTYSAMSDSASLAINSLGQLWSWGRNSDGQLGQGNIINLSSPTQVGALTNWKKIFSDKRVCCAIKTDGTLWTWGMNAQGQLGDGTTTSRSSPVQIGSSTNWVTASTGGQNGGTFAINSLGELWALGGYNGFGQLAQNDTTNRSSPVQIAGTDWKNVFVGSSTGHAIKTNGTMWGWGRGASGVIGNNSTNSLSSPVQIGALTDWSNVRKASNYSTAAVRTNGTLWAWGDNGAGSLGQNDTINRSSPVQVGALTTWVKVTNAGTYGCLARKTDGTLWSWGSNYGGSLGIGDTYNRSSPVQIGSLTTWVINGFGGNNQANTSAIKTP
jgi:alpha-tubulin suppressor-like RCC1 family protein